MNVIIHDDSIKLHMGDMEQVKSILDIVANDYNKTWSSNVYRMRKEDIKRARLYVRSIQSRCKDINATLKEFDSITK